MPHKDIQARRDYAKKWRLANLEKIRGYYRKSYAIHKDKMNEKRKVKKIIYEARYRQKIRSAVLAFLGNKCNVCGFDDYRALQVDHVRGGGSKERKKNKNSYQAYKLVLTDTTGKYQLLCANCNWIKRYENNEVAQRTNS